MGPAGRSPGPGEPPELPTDPDASGTSGAAQRRWDVALVIAAGGAIGGGARHLLTVLWPHDGVGVPWATLVANTLGSLLLGLLMVFLLDVWSPRRFVRPFFGVGLLGGFTTFSTFASEVDALLRNGAAPVAMAYLFATVAAGLLAAFAGIALARAVAGVGRTRRRTP